MGPVSPASFIKFSSLKRIVWMAYEIKRENDRVRVIRMVFSSLDKHA